MWFGIACLIVIIFILILRTDKESNKQGYDELFSLAEQARQNGQIFDCTPHGYKVWFMNNGCKFHCEYVLRMFPDGNSGFYGPQNIECVWSP